MPHRTPVPSHPLRSPPIRPGRPGTPASLHRVTLTLARCPDYPDGSAGRALRDRGPARTGRPPRRPRSGARPATIAACAASWTGEPDRHGRLVHRAGGEGGATWLIDYDDRTTDDDEPGYRLGARLRQGQSTCRSGRRMTRSITPSWWPVSAEPMMGAHA
ncbi:hypothetical protein ACU4GR_02465 [Methylobacterium oryzae CBMB20]